jgi:hypothetical protein
MKYYSRTITKREAINRFGKLGFVPYVEMFKTNNEKVYEQMNKSKRVRFYETTDKKLIKMLRSGKANTIIEIKESDL